MTIPLDTDALLTGNLRRVDDTNYFTTLMHGIQDKTSSSAVQMRNSIALANNFLDLLQGNAPRIMHRSWLDLYNPLDDTILMGDDDRFGFLTPDLTLRPFILILRGGSKPFMQAGLAEYGGNDTLPPLNTATGRHTAGITAARPTPVFVMRHNLYTHVNQFFNVMWAWRETAYFEGEKFQSAAQYSTLSLIHI